MEDSLILRTLEQWLQYIQTQRLILIKKNTPSNQAAYLSKLMSFKIVVQGLMDGLMLQVDDAIAKSKLNI
jgi:hypothetical protein